LGLSISSSPFQTLLSPFLRSLRHFFFVKNPRPDVDPGPSPPQRSRTLFFFPLPEVVFSVSSSVRERFLVLLSSVRSGLIAWALFETQEHRTVFPNFPWLTNQTFCPPRLSLLVSGGEKFFPASPVLAVFCASPPHTPSPRFRGVPARPRMTHQPTNGRCFILFHSL